MSDYDLASVRVPRLTGAPLRLFVAALENPASRALLIGRLLHDAGVERLRSLPIDEAPTFAPIAVDASASNRDPVGPLDAVWSVPRPRSPVATARDYAYAYRNGSCTPVDVAERLLKAVGESREGARALRAVTACHEDDLRSQARASAARFASRAPLGPLDGVPVGVKDEIDVAGYGTTVGTSFLGATPALSDATTVARLRAAGALIFGKLAMNEIGINPDGANMTTGFVCNPYHPSHDTGGSSSGSAAAVAAGLCPIALGADGGGSIRIPAGLCGVVGLKATFGRISEHGAAPLCWTVAHVGPIGATVEDVALAYAVIAGRDSEDAMSLHQPTPSLARWSDDDLAGLRIGVYAPWFEHAQPAVVSACDAAVRELERRGARRVAISLPGLDAVRVAHAVTIISEMRAAMQPHLARRAPFTLATRVNLALAAALTPSDYVHAQRVRTRAIATFARAFEQVDVIATPTTAITAPKVPVSAPREGWSDLTSVTEVMRFAFPGNLTGLPAISVPVGYDAGGLPIGLQWMARPWAEDVLLRVARIVEASVERRAPAIRFAPLG